MQGLVRLTYRLGWIFFALSVLARIVAYTSLSERMVYLGVLPRNFLQFSFLFFVAAIATALVEREKP